MHSTTLTFALRQQYRDSAFPRSTPMSADLAAELAMRTMIPRRRKHEQVCASCRVIIRRNATCDYC